MQQWFSNTEGHSQTSALQPCLLKKFPLLWELCQAAPMSCHTPWSQAALPLSLTLKIPDPSVSLVITKRANPLLFCCHSMFC